MAHEPQRRSGRWGAYCGVKSNDWQSPVLRLCACASGQWGVKQWKWDLELADFFFVAWIRWINVQSDDRAELVWDDNEIIKLISIGYVALIPVNAFYHAIRAQYLWIFGRHISMMPSCSISPIRKMAWKREQRARRNGNTKRDHRSPSPGQQNYTLWSCDHKAIHQNYLMLPRAISC